MNSTARSRRTTRLSTVLAIVSGIAVATGCGATTFDESIASSTTALLTTSTVPTGTTEELLTSLAESMSGLSGLIGPDSSGRTPPGKNEAIARIEALWEAARTDVTARDPEAADAIERMVVLARTAVDRSRPADADKAWRFAGQVIDKFLGAA